jgi:hypothetical protein
MNSLEGYGDIFVSRTEKAADADNKRDDLAGLVHQDILNIADLGSYPLGAISPSAGSSIYHKGRILH